LSRLGFIPRGGESFETNGLRFTVMEMDRRRVSRVKIKPLAGRVESAATRVEATLPAENFAPASAAKERRRK